jgi:hypothetical protein
MAVHRWSALAVPTHESGQSAHGARSDKEKIKSLLLRGIAEVIQDSSAFSIGVASEVSAATGNLGAARMESWRRLPKHGLGGAGWRERLD